MALCWALWVDAQTTGAAAILDAVVPAGAPRSAPSGLADSQAQLMALFGVG